MSFSVGLYRDSSRQGGITFSTVPATQSSDDAIAPKCVLSHAVEQLHVPEFLKAK
jgi:hypothetical protein